MTTTTRAIEVGQRIGRAMSRDAKAEGMSAEWTGIDPQDADVATAAGLVPDTEEWAAMESAAKRAFLAAGEPAETMAGMLTGGVEVRRHNGQCEYGPWLPVDHEDDVPSWVADLVADAIAEGGDDEGMVSQGGCSFAWRKRAEKTPVEVTVMRYVDGEPLGTTPMSADKWGLYADGTHPAYQWPQGIARAGDVLSDDTLDRLAIDPDTTIYLD